MEEKLRVILNKFIYDKLNLKDVENKLVEFGIKNKSIVKEEGQLLISNYFFLMNDIYIERLTDSEKQILEMYMKQLDGSELKIGNDLYSFLEKNLLKLLLPVTDSKYLFWGGSSYEHMAPSDSIVLYFHYIKYIGIDEIKIEKNEEFINNNLNYIQEYLGPKNGIKVSVIKFDETIGVKKKSVIL